MDVDMKAIYARMKRLVKERKTSLTHMGEAIGIPIGTIKNWGRGTEASLGNLAAIARYFDVSVDYLIGNTTDPSSHKEGDKLAVWTEVRDLAQRRLDELQKQND